MCTGLVPFCVSFTQGYQNGMFFVCVLTRQHAGNNTSVNFFLCVFFGFPLLWTPNLVQNHDPAAGIRMKPPSECRLRRKKHSPPTRVHAGGVVGGWWVAGGLVAGWLGGWLVGWLLMAWLLVALGKEHWFRLQFVRFDCALRKCFPPLSQVCLLRLPTLETPFPP